MVFREFLRGAHRASSPSRTHRVMNSAKRTQPYRSLPLFGRVFLALLSLAFVTQAQTSMPKELVLQTNHTGFIRALAISPDSQFAASGGQDQTIKIWSITDSRLWRTIEGTPGFIKGLAYS